MKSVFFSVLVCSCSIVSSISCIGQKSNRTADRSETISSNNCKSDFGLYVFSYGRSSYPDRFLNVEEERGNREIVYLFYLIRFPGKNILVDSGFINESYRKKFGFLEFENPVKLLKKCGIDPKEITDIVLTHFHFDHAGGIFLFPSAKIHIQNHDLDLLKKQNYFPNQASFIRSADSTGRLHSFDGTFSLLPDLRILFTGGHTPGSQALEWVVSSGKGFLFTGDECYLIEECKKGIGLPQEAAFSLKRNRDFLDYVRIVSEKGTKILTLHDPSILLQGREIVPGVRRIESF
ncbi:N-acyl homoserine lactonase family protein [Leptospira gomenensis]|uniref:N-acyl homoserine lactonase family protein n=1 Tax=Leptospira gomenensis TaxID=2484974 RepID=A0A5F1Y5Z4_9LEPT|nr:N-acyl homoserine lactonase family protein [Leptospira gomenensis]TGK28085.1 N-acyl homoserine lactonase family protein [Leptospira gomenensis]TGK37059.1 N-acyl homoserine lactonase family protein [Leptospira gomenensis]TGK45695.1 N-acyl homoserine lactonase family protein [Leptospira gomenensis]TGK59634.1 N-acyl homoserine lactonase family protein [Leptospira gomenensis]